MDPWDLFGDSTELPGEVVSSPPLEGIKQGGHSLARRSQEVGPGDLQGPTRSVSWTQTSASVLRAS